MLVILLKLSKSSDRRYIGSDSRIMINSLFVTFIFPGIIGDLFPGVTLPEPDYEVLNSALFAVMDKINLKNTEFFHSKIIQVSKYQGILQFYRLLPSSGKFI